MYIDNNFMSTCRKKFFFPLRSFSLCLAFHLHYFMLITFGRFWFLKVDNPERKKRETQNYVFTYIILSCIWHICLHSQLEPFKRWWNAHTYQVMIGWLSTKLSITWHDKQCHVQHKQMKWNAKRNKESLSFTKWCSTAFFFARNVYKISHWNNIRKHKKRMRNSKNK